MHIFLDWMRSRDSKTRYGGRRQAQSSLSARYSGHSSLSVVRQPSPSLRMPRMSHSLRIAPSSAEGCVKYCLAQAKSPFQRPILSERLRSRSKPCCVACRRGLEARWLWRSEVRGLWWVSCGAYPYMIASQPGATRLWKPMECIDVSCRFSQNRHQGHLVESLDLSCVFLYSFLLRRE